MIGGFCLQPLPGQVQGQLAGQATLISVNIVATPSLSVANISEGAGRAGEAPVNYAFRMAPATHLDSLNHGKSLGLHRIR